MEGTLGNPSEYLRHSQDLEVQNYLAEYCIFIRSSRLNNRLEISCLFQSGVPLPPGEYGKGVSREGKANAGREDEREARR